MSGKIINFKEVKLNYEVKKVINKLKKTLAFLARLCYNKRS